MSCAGVTTTCLSLLYKVKCVIKEEFIEDEINDNSDIMDRVITAMTVQYTRTHSTLLFTRSLSQELEDGEVVFIQIR